MGIAANGIGCGNSVRAFDRPPVRALESPRHQMAVANVRGAAGFWHEPADGVTFGTQRLGVCRRHHRGNTVARLLVGAKARAGRQNHDAHFGRHRYLRRFGHCRREFGHWGFGGGNRRVHRHDFSAERRRALRFSARRSFAAFKPGAIRSVGGRGDPRYFLGGRRGHELRAGRFDDRNGG